MSRLGLEPIDPEEKFIYPPSPPRTESELLRSDSFGDSNLLQRSLAPSSTAVKAYDHSMNNAMDLTTVTLILLWYASNIGVLLLNKYLLSIYGFKYPLFLTLCHMLACSLLSYAVSFLNYVPRQGIKSKKQFFKISVLALVFCWSVVGGNISLKYLPVSFNQAVGATTPFFTAIFAALMLSKIETMQTYLALVPVVVGIVLASGGEPLFHLYGFIICICATAARAFKSVLQGILLQSDTEKMNSMNLLMYMAPISVAALIPATLAMEVGAVSKAITLATESKGFIMLLGLNSVMAYFVNLTNFLVTKSTSALTLQVLGNAKGVVATVVSILLFKNPVSTTGMVGYSITVVGVILYSEAKKRSTKAIIKQKILESEEDMEKGASHSGSGSNIHSRGMSSPTHK
eukprot:CAMPEP_0197851652 /NCGR_PEP_ID=MMETSP1438-20131217/18539_1 /TAXON_ID=1461541 /ORGANISM="Pterosperma sp., Strain CCMP1384" /LENGTH=401 /DNA_ID=CAMNT_0043465337 /DNA_START=306 /DNA_END=1511 /DNA_ORIENTATION=-